jgi:ribonuclease P protein component
MLDKASDPTPRSLRGARLSKHADYQRVYKQSRKHFSVSMTYFFRLREAGFHTGPRIGLTAGRVLGKAVERNRIKRRMREAVRASLGHLRCNVDVVLHPRRSVLEIEFSRLCEEVAAIFTRIEAAARSKQRGE